jgi:hypothetical protein
MMWICVIELKKEVGKFISTRRQKWFTTKVLPPEKSNPR